MANGFGSLFIGVSGLQSSQNGLNTTSNNLANIDTAGYVRQRVFYSDRNYQTMSTTAAISKQQAGLGVKIGDVLHTRDVFLDKSYRTTYGRQQFYEKTAEAAGEVETYFQEMEGAEFWEALDDFKKSFQEMAKYPGDDVCMELVIQKAQLFVSRASAAYSGLQNYQYNINKQIKDDIDRMNELGKNIAEWNLQIQKIEVPGIETAMTLRDERDKALDELAGLVELEYHETADGILKITVDNIEFVNENGYNEIGTKTDGSTGFVTPYWEFLSDEKRDEYVGVLNFKRDISAENGNDRGALKALILARGDYVGDYRDVENLTQERYNDKAGMSVMLRSEAQLDQLLHNIITDINDLFAPNTAASDYITTGWDPSGVMTVTDENGNDIQITRNTLILDMEHCPVGADEKLPPRELFNRIGCKRYTEITANGETYYMYNTEDLRDPSKMYTIKSVSVNQDLVVDEGLMPYMTLDGEGKMVDRNLAANLEALWDAKDLTLNPNDTRPVDYMTYYTAMIGELATFGDIFGSTAASMEDGALSTDNARQQVIGTSADEELVSMIKFQNAYNASSRFINVINEMIEHLITQLG